jgi:hypothetical protein
MMHFYFLGETNLAVISADFVVHYQCVLPTLQEECFGHFMQNKYIWTLIKQNLYMFPYTVVI